MKLTGLIAATHTPFDSQGDLNLDAVPAQAAWLMQNQVPYAFICGSTGESHSLTLDERLRLATRWMEVARGTRLQIIVHVGSNCLRDAAALAAHAQSVGARAISALAPSYFKPGSIPLLVSSMAEIARQAPEMPFYYYDIPSLTNLRLSAVEFLETAAAEIPNLAGLKFTNEDYAALQQCLNVAQERWDILWGVDEALLAAASLGVQGAVGSSYNFAARIYQRLLTAFQQGNLSAARREQWRAVEVIRTVAAYGYLPAAKHVMQILGVPVGPARLPLGALTDEQVRELQQKLETLGFFEWVAA